VVDEEDAVDRKTSGRDTAVDEHCARKFMGNDLREVPTHEVLRRSCEVTAVDTAAEPPERAPADRAGQRGSGVFAAEDKLRPRRRHRFLSAET